MDESTDSAAAGDAEGGPARIERVLRSPAGELVVHLAGREEPHKDARVARCFPWTLPDTYISVRDNEGKEIALLQTLDDLPPESREVIEAELASMIFNPKIRRVREWKHEFGVTSIQCETDRGDVTFQIRSREDVRILSPVRALLRDVDGSTYELADLSQLDPASQKHFMQFF